MRTTELDRATAARERFSMSGFLVVRRMVWAILTAHTRTNATNVGIICLRDCRAATGGRPEPLAGRRAIGRSDRDLDLGHLADLRDHGALDRLVTGCQRAQRPLPGGGEEAELPGRGGRHLRGELTAPVKQSDVRRADRRTLVDHDPLDHGLL